MDGDKADLHPAGEGWRVVAASFAASLEAPGSNPKRLWPSKEVESEGPHSTLIECAKKSGHAFEAWDKYNQDRVTRNWVG